MPRGAPVRVLGAAVCAGVERPLTLSLSPRGEGTRGTNEPSPLGERGPAAERREGEGERVLDMSIASEEKAKGVSTGPMLSALVVARNEEKQLAACLETLSFADEIVVLLDRTTDRSAEIARMFGANVVEGAWPLEGERRTAGAEACRGEWVIEV